MKSGKLRDVALWQTDIAWERRADGAVLVWQTGALPPYPDRLSDRIAHWAQVSPQTTWMAERDDAGNWARVDYAELFVQVRSIGQALLDLNLSTERPLVILSGNSIAHALMALGAQYVGIPSAALAPAYATSSGDFVKLRQIRDQITPGAVFADDLAPFTPAIDAVFTDLPRLGLRGAGRVIDWDSLLVTPVTGAVDAANQATGPDTVAKFMFTSGTTGAPKAVIQTQRMLCSNMEMVRDCFAYLKDEPPVLLDWAPWNHVAAGNKLFNMALYNGGTFYIDAGKPSPALIGQTIANLRDVSPNWYFNVPVGFEMLVEAMRSDQELAQSFFRNLKLMMYAGAAMAEHTWAELDRLAIEVTGERILLSTGLGSTETAPHALFCTEPQEKPGNVGLPNKGLTLKLVPVDGKWEAHVKGPSITPGYWRDAKLTAEAFDDEGFYNFGDALRFADPDDPSKGFFFDGRTAENFKLATGTWVSVGMLRAKLTNALDGLARDVVIAGEGQTRLGALLLPFRPAIERLVPNGATLSDAALYAHPVLRAKVAELLARHNATAGGSSMRVPLALFLTEPLDFDKGEVTDKGSVNQRAVLRQRSNLIEALFAGDPQVIDSQV
ncbi:feruloyl-CoA synthase [Puniceibacterium sp. IMCC21224]|uniref:feruloyl-CoA synthase n=1 Tax=Puniceibacterium sp. IMCC21224 TaxID=1618204 RepID=UPI00064DE21F|nr:feruloyl-CoA synthase [Puniceibacterium sp. IMCC21224]KMK66559.1 acyl-CoA synthetase (AMP-forming)/AMP-acid ligase II [Puniceibacterium sp. IMCC21224]